MQSLRSTSTMAASTSRRCAVPCVSSRRSCVVVRAADAMCRDMVGQRKEDVESKGKTFKLTFVAAGGETRVAECPDNVYILDAAEKAGIDLPGELLAGEKRSRNTKCPFLHGATRSPCGLVPPGRPLCCTRRTPLTHPMCLPSSARMQPPAAAASAVPALHACPRAQPTCPTSRTWSSP